MSMLEMTTQQVFDTVIEHLIKQGKQAKASTGHCSYRTTDGLKCAVGCLIPDELYNPILEGRSVEGIRSITLRQYIYPTLYTFIDKNFDILQDLQSLHDSDNAWDSNTFSKIGKSEIESIIKSFNLDDTKYRSLM